MDSSNVISEQNLATTRELLAEMEAGDESKARQSLETLVRSGESKLYQELGKLTRDLHDALNSFRLDARISDIAAKEIPDARERLNYVISMTDKAANTTLNAVEESMPMCESLENQAGELQEQWQQFVQRKLGANEFRELSQRLGDFLQESADSSRKIRGNFNDVLMAQDFQDLTGQIIKKVITLVEEVEGNLVNLVKLSGEQAAPEQEKEKSEEEKRQEAIAGQGPVVPGVDSGEVLSGQDDVDDLLSSLGF